MTKSSFVCCEKCGKRLLERRSNGLWHFKFGKSLKDSEPIVDILIYGSLSFKCTRRSCRHVNILNFFPDTFVQSCLEKPEGAALIIPQRK